MPIPFLDTFDRASGNLDGSTSSDGQFSWGSFRSGTWSISNDVQAGVAENDGIITASFGVADDILIESQLESNASDQGICFRCEGTTDHCRLVLNAGTAYLQEKNGGAYSTISSFGHSFAVGDWMGVRLDGTNVYVTKNGVDVHGPVSMTLNPTATHHGLAGAVGGVGITTSAAFRLTDADTVVWYPLTSGVDTTAAATTRSTASVTPSANRLVLAAFYVNSTLTGTPTCSGNGLTWANIADVTFGDGTRRMLVYRAMGAAPTAGAITITRANADTLGDTAWSVVEFTGIDTSGTNGSGAIVNVETGNSSPTTDPFTLTFSPAMTAGNGAFSWWSILGGLYNAAPRSGWTELHENGVGGTLNTQSQFRMTTDTDAGVNFNAGGGGHSLGAAIEIKAAAAGGGGGGGAAKHYYATLLGQR